MAELTWLASILTLDSASGDRHWIYAALTGPMPSSFTKCYSFMFCVHLQGWQSSTCRERRRSALGQVSLHQGHPAAPCYEQMLLQS